MNKFKAVILAAGQGTRMRSNKPKVVHEILGKPMVAYVVDAAKEAGAQDVIVVTGYKEDVVRKSIDGVLFANQREQLGTGHAVLVAEDLIGEDGNVIILYGDTPLIDPNTLERMLNHHIKNDLSVTVMSAVVNDPTGYGRIIRENGKFLRIVEQKDANEEEVLINETNTGVYCFKTKDLKYALSKLDNNNVQAEYYLTDTLEILLKQGLKIDAIIADKSDEFYGVNSRVNLSVAEQVMKKKINSAHMINGVTIIDPLQTYIGKDVCIGEDTIIYPNTILEGSTCIGQDCIIGPNTRVKNSEVKDSVKIDNSIVLESKIGDGTTVGPFSYIRPNSNIGKNVKIGDFVEVKNTNIGNNTKASHLTYLGDADIGSNINIGCGTVTVNYDGKNKGRTVIEDDAFIGCNTNLIAPVKVEKDAYIAAGSTITDDVPKGCLGIARQRQVIKKNWHKK